MAENVKKSSTKKSSTKKSSTKKNVVKPDVMMLNSIATALLDKDGNVAHVQIVIGQYVESGQFVCYFDVVDPSKVKLADDTVSASVTD